MRQAIEATTGPPAALKWWRHVAFLEEQNNEKARLIIAMICS
jgi:hypothetical protein